MAARYKELITNLQIVELDDCGHWTPWEQPKTVAKEIMRFLDNYA